MPSVSPEILRDPARLEALRATGLIDAPQQEALDRLTRLATKLLGTPIALVSLVDENRQHFVSEVGLDEPWRTARGTPLSHSFCQHVVATRAALVVSDARSNPLVADNLAVPEMGVIAYAGMPLTSESGEVLGSLCAIDTVPRTWSPSELALLEDLAHAASAEMQLRAASRLLVNRQTFLSDMLDHTSELVCAIDERGRISYANRAMLATCGFSAEQLASMRAVDLIAEEFRAPFIEAATRVRGGEEVGEFETVVVTAGGDHRFCRGTATPVKDDATVVGARVMFRDLTREREAQRLKDELIALVSHELRTPAGAIRGALKILGPHVAHLEGKPRRFFEMATRNADRLLALVNDLLDIERMESGHATLVVTSVPSAVLLEHARDAVLPLAENAGIDLAIGEAAGTARVDDSRIQQVLVNLIGNAIKFSPAGSTISLTARPQSEEGSEIRFGVSDQGRGIPADKLLRVFERFEQVSSADATEMGGAGLGLAVCKAIVEQHGGRIWVESTEGAGSQFYFTVRAAD